MCSKSESGFWFHFEKDRRLSVQILLRTRKQYPAGSIQTIVHPWRFGKVGRFSQQNWRHRVFNRERMNTKWRLYKLTNLTVFAALLKDVPMGCKDPVLSEPLLKNWTINRLTFEENTRQPYNDNLCLFRDLAPHLHGNQRVEEETSKVFNLFINKMGGLSADQIQGVHLNDLPFVEGLLTSTLCCMISILWMATLSENLLDEVCRKTKLLCHCWDTATT